MYAILFFGIEFTGNKYYPPQKHSVREYFDFLAISVRIQCHLLTSPLKLVNYSLSTDSKYAIVYLKSQNQLPYTYRRSKNVFVFHSFVINDRFIKCYIKIVPKHCDHETFFGLGAALDTCITVCQVDFHGHAFIIVLTYKSDLYMVYNVCIFFYTFKY